MVFEGIPLSAWEIGGWGLFVALALFVLRALINGVLYPASVVEVYKSALRIERETDDANTAVLQELLEHARTSASILEGMQDREEVDSRDDRGE